MEDCRQKYQFENLDNLKIQDNDFAMDYKDLNVFNLAFESAMRIFEISKSWPKKERYSLTDQIRRSSRSVCANISEAWRKRRYPSHFVSKLSDADTVSSLFALHFSISPTVL